MVAAAAIPVAAAAIPVHGAWAPACMAGAGASTERGARSGPSWFPSFDRDGAPRARRIVEHVLMRIVIDSRMGIRRLSSVYRPFSSQYDGNYYHTTSREIIDDG